MLNTTNFPFKIFQFVIFNSIIATSNFQSHVLIIKQVINYLIIQKFSII